ncbi:hypothetical protein A4E84_04125 [Streptomyces qaidamensis]|uniref:Uncharacterized protein n=1 Tax=Streptomyces qaidamensis TaxID=1783515 RepID=A0A143BUF4_9ACTN|nr:hypothetical protein A4E84_04125 [Streptomyces qaidamensis]
MATSELMPMMSGTMDLPASAVRTLVLKWPPMLVRLSLKPWAPGMPFVSARATSSSLTDRSQVHSVISSGSPSERCDPQPTGPNPPAAAPAPSARNRLRDTVIDACTTFRASGPPPDPSGSGRTDIANGCSG